MQQPEYFDVQKGLPIETLIVQNGSRADVKGMERIVSFGRIPDRRINISQSPDIGLSGRWPSYPPTSAPDLYHTLSENGVEPPVVMRLNALRIGGYVKSGSRHRCAYATLVIGSNFLGECENLIQLIRNRTT